MTQDVKNPELDQNKQPLGVQCFEHRGEVVVVFSQPIAQWFLSAEMARKFAETLIEMAKSIEVPAGAPRH